MNFATIIAEAAIESANLDVTVCGGARPCPIKRQQRQDKIDHEEQKALRVELYSEQWKPRGDEGDDTNWPADGGEIQYEVDEMKLYDKQMRFCQRMIECGVLTEEDFA